MPASGGPGPAARVLAEAASRNAALGHENAGPLSESHGFLARCAPRHDLPPPHDAWVAAVDELPDLCSSLRLRRRLDELPLLDASPDALDDRHLLRAASVLGLLAHAYSNVPMRPPERLPAHLVRPWLQTAERLGRPAFTLSNSDYIFDNWRIIDPDAPEPMRVDNLRVLNAIWDHPQMDTFILVLVELLARSAPLVGAAARAQDACLRSDDEVVAAELVVMIETVRRLTGRSLPKISANARAGARRVDPVLWTKLFAMLPLPVQGAGDDVRNASGAETPYFHLLDVVLGRREYETQLGHEAMQFRHTHPPHWREFIAAVGRESIASYVRDRGDRELSNLFAELADAYHGPHGLLARHRLKAFAYMEAAFKTGRSSTVTGFTGLFEDRAWETVDASFEAARLERVRSAPAVPRLARVAHVEELGDGARSLVLDVGGLGLRFRPGDRCAVLADEEAWQALVTSASPDRVEVTGAGRAIGRGEEIPVSVVPSVGFAPPSDPSVPIVMLADGVGIAPFLAFLDARPRGARNVLFAGSSPDALRRRASREDVELLDEPPTAASVRELTEAGASIYVCGDPAFARSMMESAADALGRDVFADLIVQHRYLLEVLPGPIAPHRQIDASELARHNEPGDDIWTAIDGRVYDLTAFGEMHPGGQRLIHSFAGMDATRTYRIVEHHRDPSIDALLSVFEIGSMRRLCLEPSLETLFRHWLRTQYLLTEIENAHELDASVRGEPLRRREQPGALEITPYRLQFALEAHRRFLDQTLAIVCRRVGELWRETSDGAAADELDGLLAGPEASAARARCDELELRLEGDGASADLDELLTERQEAERFYLREAKSLVASGVRVFELHEAEATTRGRDALLGALRGIVPLTRAHLAAATAPRS